MTDILTLGRRAPGKGVVLPGRGKYPAEFKAEAVELCRSSDKSIRDIATELGISVDGFGWRCLRQMIESFFATLETELLDRLRFKSRRDARLAIFDFIEGSTTVTVCTRRSATSLPLSSRKSTKLGSN